MAFTDVLSDTAGKLATGYASGAFSGGAKSSQVFTNQQNQNMNFNPVISVGGAATGAYTPYSSTPSFSAPVSTSQEDRTGLAPSYPLYSTSGETSPTEAAVSGGFDMSKILLMGGIAFAAYYVLKGAK